MKRDKTIGAKVTDREKAVIERVSEGLGVTVSRFAREAILRRVKEETEERIRSGHARAPALVVEEEQSR